MSPGEEQVQVVGVHLADHKLLYGPFRRVQGLLHIQLPVPVGLIGHLVDLAEWEW